MHLLTDRISARLKQFCSLNQITCSRLRKWAYKKCIDSLRWNERNETRTDSIHTLEIEEHSPGVKLNALGSANATLSRRRIANELKINDSISSSSLELSPVFSRYIYLSLIQLSKMIQTFSCGKRWKHYTYLTALNAIFGLSGHRSAVLRRAIDRTYRTTL